MVGIFFILRLVASGLSADVASFSVFSCFLFFGVFLYFLCFCVFVFFGILMGNYKISHSF